MAALKLVNLLVRFLLELCLLLALGYWGFKTGQVMIVKIGLGLGLPLVAAVIWGIFLAPASNRRLQEPWLLLVELILFGAAFAALYNTGQRSLTLAFGLIYVINKILIVIWGQS
jgi:hypothetical protein